jgi:hypothetical protein
MRYAKRIVLLAASNTIPALPRAQTLGAGDKVRLSDHCATTITMGP